jgi:hypothetical protein
MDEPSLPGVCVWRIAVKRFVALLSLVAVAGTSAFAAGPAGAAATPSPAKQRIHPASKKAAVRSIPAPADEYFGKLKLSILGIRNTIKDVGANIDVDASRWPGLMSKADFAEDAIHDWERHYPTDSWLPKTLFALERMYAKIDTDDGRKRSMAAMQWLVHDYPNSWYGKTGRQEIAQHRVGHPLDPVNTAAENAAPAGLQSALPSYGNPNGTANLTAGNGGPAATPVPNPIATPH